MDNWKVLIFTAAISLAVTILSKLYDRHVEHRYGAKEHLTEKEVALAIKKAENAGTLEGYAWTRMKELDVRCDELRKQVSDLREELSSLREDYERATERIAQFENEKKQLEDRLRADRETGK